MKWEHDWAFTKELISEMFARYKMNRIAPEIHMMSASYPEIPLPNENPVTLASAQDFLNFCRLHYITDIVTWYPGPPQGSPPGPEECVLDPERIARMNQMYADDVKHLNASYIHTHLSELNYLGCAAERETHSNQWLYNTLMWQHYDATYKAHGVEPLMWGDMLRPDWPPRFRGGPVHDAISTMPPMIIADWEYGTPGNVPTDYPSLDRWIQYGKKALGVPYGFGSYQTELYGDKENIYYWANAVFSRSASHPDLMLGILAFNKYMVKDRDRVVSNEFEQQVLGCFPYYGEWGWNPDGRCWKPYPYGNGWSAVMRQLAPARVSELTASGSGNDVVLNWTNPSDHAFAGAYIVYSANRCPATPVDGTHLADIAGVPGEAGTYTHVRAPEGLFYSVFAHDDVRHFSPPVGIGPVSE